MERRDLVEWREEWLNRVNDAQTRIEALGDISLVTDDVLDSAFDETDRMWDHVEMIDSLIDLFAEQRRRSF